VEVYSGIAKQSPSWSAWCRQLGIVCTGRHFQDLLTDFANRQSCVKTPRKKLGAALSCICLPVWRFIALNVLENMPAGFATLCFTWRFCVVLCKGERSSGSSGVSYWGWRIRSRLWLRYLEVLNTARVTEVGLRPVWRNALNPARITVAHYCIHTHHIDFISLSSTRKERLDVVMMMFVGRRCPTVGRPRLLERTSSF
jgi:hypothetical protein